MTAAFWIISALLLLVALAFVVWPLWRASAKNNDVVRDAANLEIVRDQMAELDRDLANGLLTQEAYDQGRRELQARLLEEVKTTEAAVAAAKPLKVLALVLVVLVPLGAIALYWQLGNQNALLPADQRVSAAEFGLATTESALKELEDKVAKDPMNPNGIVTLARSLAEMGKFNEAVQQYEKLVQIVPNEPEVWAEFADTAVMANGQSFLGKPTEYLDHALALDPNNTKALALSGMAAMERRDYAAAIKHWQALLQQMPNKDSEEARMIMGGVQRAHDLLMQQKGGKGKLPMISQGPAQQAPAAQVAPGQERITGTVALAPSMKAKADPNDTVFILAKAVNGPPMPLAVLRKQVKDLPMQFSLDDSMAMAPQMKLSGFDKVVVVARVSKSGNAMPQVGDLQGMSGAVKPGTAGLKINIDQAIQ